VDTSKPLSMKDLPEAIREVAGTRGLTEVEIAKLRAQGNRGDLDQLWLGPLCRSDVLEAIHASTFVGPSLLLGPAGLDLDSACVRSCILAGASVRHSEVAHCVLGDGVSVSHQSVIDSSVLLPFRRVVAGSPHLFQVLVNASHVQDSVLWGGTDVGPFCHVRSHSVVGPFVHLGTGTEVKASCLFGATARNKIELPHRSYFGNASAKALRLEADFGTDPYFLELERKLPALFQGEVESCLADEDVPGAVQPLERMRVRHRDEELVLEVEGSNFGALTTTSNFDPRHGGVKLPTNVEAGARFGILAMIQAPAHVAPGVLVASGAKISGASVPPSSLVLSALAGTRVLPGYLATSRARLGEGTAEAAALTRACLRQLRVFQRVFAAAADEARGLERLALGRAHAEIGFQIAEIASWFHRYLDLVKISAAHLAEDLSTEADPERRNRLRVRAAEQRRLAEIAPAQIAELDAMRTEARQESEGLWARLSMARAVQEHAERWAQRALSHPEALRLLPAASENDIEAARKAIRDACARFERGRIFGTSGIRGIYRREHELEPSAALEKEGILTPGLAYLLGRALGRFLKHLGAPGTAAVAVDGRPSGRFLAVALAEGLGEEGIEVVDHGVCTTPGATSFTDRLAVVVTASHNPPGHNGIKVFLEGLPLARSVEDELEEEIRLLEALALRGRALLPARPCATRARLQNAANEAFERHLGSLRQELDRLGLSGQLAPARLPVDLARGAAAALVQGDRIVPSAPLSFWLEQGVVLVAFGGERDGERVNERLGAAYAYGEARVCLESSERDVQPGPGELQALACGAYGYGAGRFSDGRPAGAPASRSIYWPAALRLDPALKAEARPVVGGHWAFLDLDSPGREALRDALARALEPLPLLPALSVDGDADRLLVTDPATAARPPGFLSGDALLMIFAAFAHGAPPRVVFTVESELTLERFLEVRNIPFDVVTVGDRAVAQCMLARAHAGAPERRALVGGEPSGHLIFASAEGAPVLTDDPFVAHLRLVALARESGRAPGELWQALQAEVPEAPAVRKPDAWAPDPKTGHLGITLAEKAALNLRPRGASAGLSDYAARFIPEYLRIFGEGYARLYHGAGAEASARLAPEFEELRSGQIEPGPGKREVRVAEVVVLREGEEVERLTARVQVAGVEYFGPDDIVLRFWALDPQGRPVKAGEVVARNSGTSAKNAAYHKLWPVHLPDGREADPVLYREVLEEIARRRAAFTDQYVLEVLRRAPRR
jgi:phosphomannomutase